MKSFLILVLSLALAAAALLTRPGKREFMLYLLDRELADDKSWTPAAIDRAEDLAKRLTFRNRLLWTDIEQDGKVLYTGAFAQWVARGEQAEKPLPSAVHLARLVAQR